MSFLSSIFCVNCYKFYDDTRKPCTGTCNHSICLHCQTHFSPLGCPICDKEEAFSKPVINYAGLKIQQLMRNELTEQSIREFVNNQMNKDAGPCGECGDHSEKLRICVDCALKSGHVRQTAKKYILNTTGTTIIGAFLKAKSMSICSTCASDGEHAEHRIEHFIKIIRDKVVDIEIYTILGTLMDQMYAKEEQKAKTDMQKRLIVYKRSAWDIDILWHEDEMIRELKPISDEMSHSERSMMRMKCRLRITQKKIFEQLHKLLLSSKERSEDADDYERTVKKMEDVLANISQGNEETLSSQELEEIDERIQGRIRVYTVNPEKNVFLDQQKAIRNHKRISDQLHKQHDVAYDAKCSLKKLSAKSEDLPELIKKKDKFINERFEYTCLKNSLDQAEEENDFCHVIYLESIMMEEKTHLAKDYKKKFAEDMRKYHVPPEVFRRGVLHCYPNLV